MSQQVISGGEPGVGRSQEEKVFAARADDRGVLLRLLDERLRFETLLSRLSATFIHLPAEDVDGQIERALKQIVEFLGIERSTLAQFSEDGSQFVVTHSHSIPGFSPFPHVDLTPMLPWYTAKVREGRVLRFARLPDDLPPEASHERELVLGGGFPISHLVIPFRVGDAVLGGIGFGTYRWHRDWPDALVDSLQLLSDIFGNALARKRAEITRRETEGRFRVMADTAPVMIWMSGPDKRCTYFNKPWLDFTGRPLQAELGDGWSAGLHPDDSERCLQTYVRAFDAREDFRMEYRLRRADGDYRWVLDAGVPRFTASGAFEGYIGSCMDITDRKRAEEQETHLRDQLTRVGRVTLMGELAASIAHEVNQPLCAIVSNAQAARHLLAAESLDLDEAREAVQDIAKDGQRASEVIARIRGFLQKAPPEHAPVDVNDLIREVCAVMRHDMSRRGVAIKLELADDLPSVLGRRIPLQQVILNLMANGADAMSSGARASRLLVIRSSADAAGTLTVTVRDAGVGIERADADRIFDAFFTTKPAGMGMGLAICKSIITGHGGAITALPNAEGGTTFQFTLPGYSSPSRSGAEGAAGARRREGGP